ncbi:substrate-binding domain-containing protein [Rhodococcus sp. 27YEA15]|uniref:substrate-binding domain-containing protein n=1 Tax=Rhodococcus sp. 27YEA15 TaxID=3156259 RepID=UPI003C7B4134
MDTRVQRSSRPTMADVAKAAGVSVMSVSYSFAQPDRVSESTRSKVFAAAEELGYSGPNRAAQSLRSGKFNNIAVVFSEKLTYAFEDAVARRFLSGIADACLDANAGLMMLPNSGRPGDLDRVRDAAVDGYIVWTTAIDDPILDAIAGTGKPACIQGGPVHEGLDLVAMDDIEGAVAIATVGLVGSTRPTVISVPWDRERRSDIRMDVAPEEAVFPVPRHRLTGYVRAVRDAGLEWNAVRVGIAAVNERSEGARLARLLLDVPASRRPDLVLAMTDELALGALDAVRELGCAAPDDVAVVGWDDIEASATAGLTTVRQSLFDQGRNAARVVLGLDERVEPVEWSIRRRTSTR